MSRRLLLLLAFTLFVRVCGNAAPAYTYDFSANCNAAYHQVLSLHFEEERALIFKEFRANPYNLMATYVSDYEDFIYLMLNCDKEEYAQRKGHFDTRLKLLEQGDEASPWYRFCKAGLYLHWTVIYMRFGEHLKAANMFRKSFALLKDNQREYPGFEYNDIFAGFEEAIVGSLPANYKWIASIVGITGSIKGGVGRLEHFVDTHNDNQPFRAETQLYLQYTRFYFMARQKEVWDMMNAPSFTVDNNLMNAYFKVYVASDYSRSDDVVKTIHKVSGQKDYNKYPFFNFQMGMALLSGLDSNCIYYFQTFLKENKGDIHVKDAWVKMAYYWYVSGHQDRANYCRAQIAKAGSTELDVDRNAEKFGMETDWPDKRLLEARLLLDGGYYVRANTLLAAINVNTLRTESDKSEYFYRLGRVHEEASDLTKAVAYFDEAIQAGRSGHCQFAARAAVHKARMYEVAGDKTKAEHFYQDALDMPAHDFQNNIDLQAKAGLNRIHEKI
jgi:tetratricopeptide (TPR) repeat protein